MADWAHRSLPAKNTPCVADAQLVETRFREKLAALTEAGSEHEVEPAKVQSEGIPGEAIPNEAIDLREAEIRSNAQELIPPAATAVVVRRRGAPIPAKTIRLRVKDHRKFVSLQPCLVCGRTPADPHHLRFAQPRAMSRKVSEEFTVPVCRIHHSQLHTHGDERLWWKRLDIDPLRIALRLWQRSRAEGAAVPSNIRRQIARPSLADNTVDRHDLPQAITTTSTEGGTRR
jgi:hypothetical protein